MVLVGMAQRNKNGSIYGEGVQNTELLFDDQPV